MSYFKRKKGRFQNLGFLHAIHVETRALRARAGVIETSTPFQPSFKRENTQQITFKKISKDSKNNKTPIDECKDRVTAVRKISELLLLQSESRWNESDPVYYILSMKWLNKLKEYLCYDYVLSCLRNAISSRKPAVIDVQRLLDATNKHPGPINNSDILMPEDSFFIDRSNMSHYLNTPLRREVQRSEFVIVSRYLWDYLKAEYGIYYSTLQISGGLNIDQEEGYERQEIRRIFEDDNFLCSNFILQEEVKKLECAKKYLILKQRASWEDVKKRFVKVVPNYSKLDYRINMRLWKLDERYTTIDNFNDYYNSSILRGDVTDDFTVPAVNLEPYNKRLVEQTVDIDDMKNPPVIICEIKDINDHIWQFKSRAKTQKLRFLVTGRELGKEYMMNQNTDSDSDHEKECDILSRKIEELQTDSVAGEFSIYFQQTLCTGEIYDLPQVDYGVFRIFEDLEVRRKRRIEEQKQRVKEKLAQEKKEKQQQKLKKMKGTIKKEELQPDEYAQQAIESGRAISCARCCVKDKPIMISCEGCRNTFYCSEKCREEDGNSHSRNCSKKFADTSFGMNEDPLHDFDKLAKVENDENMEDLEDFDGIETSMRQESLDDFDHSGSQRKYKNKNQNPAESEIRLETFSQEDSTRLDTEDKEMKFETELDVTNFDPLELKSEGNSQPQFDVEERSDEEEENGNKRENSTIIKLRNLKEENELLLGEEEQEKLESSRKLDDLIGLERDKSSNSSATSDKSENDPFCKEDNEINALLDDNASIDDNISDLSDSDNGDRKDPCFKEKIKIECVSQNSNDIEDYNILLPLVNDIDLLSQDSSELEDEPKQDFSEDFSDDEKVTSKKVKKRAPKFIPLPETDGKRLRRKRQIKEDDKIIEERKRQVDLIHLKDAGISSKTLENEAFVKMLREIAMSPEASAGFRSVMAENEAALKRLRDMTSFDDIISHLSSLTPPIFTGEYKKLKTCGLCRHRDYKNELGFFMSGFPMLLNQEASSLKVLYIKKENSDTFISHVGKMEFDEYEKYEIPIIPGKYSVDSIKDMLKATQEDFDYTKKDLSLVDMRLNVDINSLLQGEHLEFELKEGDKNAIYAYEVEKQQRELLMRDFVHIMSYDEALKFYPRFVGIDYSKKCGEVNKRIFKAIRPLLAQLFDKSITKKYEKYTSNFDDIYSEYMKMDPIDYRFRLKFEYVNNEEVITELRKFQFEKEGFSLNDKALKQNEIGLNDQTKLDKQYKQELRDKYKYKTNEEIENMLYCIEIDLQEEYYCKITDVLPCINYIEKVYVIMPPSAEFDQIKEDFNRKVLPNENAEEAIYNFKEHSIDMMLRKLVEKCVKCKKEVAQTHFISETVSLPRYFICFAKKGQERRIVMEHKIKPFKRNGLYELTGFFVFDEDEGSKKSHELVSYFRTPESEWVKILNSKMEFDHYSRINAKEISSAESLTFDQKKRKIEQQKVSGGFPVKFEEQYRHNYLYKGLIYKLISQ
ncbi:unnamed protein product [Moneuplotes crassus]|uniref:MYND-type domain-containing protein n=1 Tax=Euplotes crassus TaxID=5936 RepID=A0AAD1U4U5_EUPCR|nr:unnamed protein product [Moneuplotes crassus]